MKILVTPGMVELGEREYDLNRELGEFAADCCDAAILVGERQAPPIKEGLLKKGYPEDRIYVVKSLDEAKDKSKHLTESMHATQNSVDEIARSVKDTAEALEVQTSKTNDIQKNIDNAGKETEEMKEAFEIMNRKIATIIKKAKDTIEMNKKGHSKEIENQKKYYLP